MIYYHLYTHRVCILSNNNFIVWFCVCFNSINHSYKSLFSCELHYPNKSSFNLLNGFTCLKFKQYSYSKKEYNSIVFFSRNGCLHRFKSKWKTAISHFILYSTAGKLLCGGNRLEIFLSYIRLSYALIIFIRYKYGWLH